MRGFSTGVVVSDVKVGSYEGKTAYWYKSPATYNGSKELTTTDVDVLGAERHEIVRRADGVGGDVDTKRDDDQTDGGKCSCSTTTVRARVHPSIDDHDGVPYDRPICRLSGCGGEDAKQANDSCRAKRLAT